MGTDGDKATHALIVEAITSAARAKEIANAAHKRLDRMNGSIDTLAREVRATRTEITDRLDDMDLAEAVEQGRQQGRSQLLTPAKGYVLAVLCSIITAGVTHYLG